MAKKKSACFILCKPIAYICIVAVVFCGVLTGCRQQTDDALVPDGSQLSDQETANTETASATNPTTADSTAEPTSAGAQTTPTGALESTQPSAPAANTQTPAGTESTKPSNQTTLPTQNGSTPAPEQPVPPVSGSVIAGDKWDGGPLTWQVTSDGTLTIASSSDAYFQGMTSYIWKDYSNIITKIVVSDNIRNIPQEAFSNMTNVTSAQIGNGVTRIYASAFQGCTRLQSVVFPASLTQIDAYAFYNTGLRSLSLPSGCRLELIDEYAFANSAIAQFSSPASLRTINARAFENCTSLHTLVLEGGITTIRYNAFAGCSGLKHITLGASIDHTDMNIFEGCNSVQTVNYYTNRFADFTKQAALTTVVIGGNKRDTGSFEECTSLSQVTIQSPITVVNDYAFKGCTSLRSVTLPNSVTTINIRAFANTALSSITIPASVRTIGNRVFSGSPIQQIVFTGSCPALENNSFAGITATVYYPAGDASWDAAIGNQYGGTITWVAQ